MTAPPVQPRPWQAPRGTDSASIVAPLPPRSRPPGYADRVAREWCEDMTLLVDQLRGLRRERRQRYGR
jgi:hypothetical protein